MTPLYRCLTVALWAILPWTFACEGEMGHVPSADSGVRAGDGGPTVDAGSTPPGSDGGTPIADGGPVAREDAGAGCTDCDIPWMTGVNLSSAEWGEGSLPGSYGSDYIYPSTDEVDYFLDAGLNSFRIGFRWERLQRELYGPLHEGELDRLESLVRYATARGARVVLDPHNYAAYDGAILGPDASDTPYDAFADFWGRLGAVFADDAQVVFNLVNEPHSIPTEHWLAAVNAAIAAIRDAGATNLVAVPGVGWTTASTWTDDWYGTPNAEVMTGVVDPIGHLAFEVHQYLDENSSGGGPECVSSTIGSERLAAFTEWLRSHGYQGMLGEIAAPDTATCEAAVGDALDYLEANDDVWVGWLWWAGGPWWSSDYQLLLSPRDGEDQPQLEWLTPHLDHVR
jgi:endoglucanase